MPEALRHYERTVRSYHNPIFHNIKKEISPVAASPSIALLVVWFVQSGPMVSRSLLRRDLLHHGAVLDRQVPIRGRGGGGEEVAVNCLVLEWCDPAGRGRTGGGVRVYVCVAELC